MQAEFAQRVMEDSRTELNMLIGRPITEDMIAAVIGILRRHVMSMTQLGKLADLKIHNSDDIASLGIIVEFDRMGRVSVSFDFTGTVLE